MMEVLLKNLKLRLAVLNAEEASLFPRYACDVDRIFGQISEVEDLIELIEFEYLPRCKENMGQTSGISME